MGRPVNSNVPEAGYVSKRQFEQTGTIAGSDFSVSQDGDSTTKVTIDPSAQQPGSTVILKSGASSGTVTITLPAGSSTLATTAGASNSFATIQPPNGTSPTASSSTDTLTLTSTGATTTITGNSSTKTINIDSAGTAPTLDTSWTYGGWTAMTNNEVTWYIDQFRVLHVRGRAIPTTVLNAAANFYINLPNSWTIKSSVYSASSKGFIVGSYIRGGASLNVPANNTGPSIIFYDGSTTNKLFCSNQFDGTNGDTPQKANAAALVINNNGFFFEFEVALT